LPCLSLVAGVVVLVPIYVAILLLLKAMKSVEDVVKQLIRLLPTWFPGEAVVSLFLAWLICLLVGLSLRTAIGQAARDRIENSVLQKISGYTMFRGMTQQSDTSRRAGGLMSWTASKAVD
jgi:hypothetical protein